MLKFSPDNQNLLQRIAEEIARATKVTILTGSGVSAESGVPTFREAQTGLWAKFDPHELATPQAFTRNPGLVWEWYLWRISIIKSALPNPAHYAISQMETLHFDFQLITQNVDGLHQLAGSGQKNPVIELHGNIFKVICSKEKTTAREHPYESYPPVCDHCGALLRPGVTWFGESLSSDELDSAIQATAECDMFISVGTSSLVQPAATLPEIAKRNQATLVEINPGSTPISAICDYRFSDPAGEVLPELAAAVEQS
jgi:NAD-dependent deacetylase